MWPDPEAYVAAVEGESSKLKKKTISEKTEKKSNEEKSEKREDTEEKNDKKAKPD